MAPNLRKNSQRISSRLYSREKNEKYRKLEARRSETLKHPVKSQDHKQTVCDLVYQYLVKLTNVNDRRKQRHNARSIFHRAHIRKQPRDLHPNRHVMGLSSGKVSNSKYLPLTFENSFRQQPRPPASKEIVDKFSKAVNEGRNIARKYICKAITFAVNAGFLVPADSKGQILRVSSKLCLFQTAQDIKKNKPVKKVRYDPAFLKKTTQRRKTSSKVKKHSLKTVRTRSHHVKKKTKRRKAESKKTVQ